MVYAPVTAYPGVSLKGETGLISLSHNPVLRIGFPICVFFVDKLNRDRRGAGKKPRKSAKNMIYRAKSIDKRRFFPIMKATEQSMIEARNKISSPGNDGGTVGAKGFSAEGYLPSRSGYAWADERTSVGLSPPLRGAESCQTTPRMNLLVMNSICSVHDNLFFRRFFSCTVPSGPCCPPSSPSRWR